MAQCFISRGGGGDVVAGIGYSSCTECTAEGCNSANATEAHIPSQACTSLGRFRRTVRSKT